MYIYFVITSDLSRVLEHAYYSYAEREDFVYELGMIMSVEKHYDYSHIVYYYTTRSKKIHIMSGRSTTEGQKKIMTYIAQEFCERYKKMWGILETVKDMKTL